MTALPVHSAFTTFAGSTSATAAHGPAIVMLSLEIDEDSAMFKDMNGPLLKLLRDKSRVHVISKAPDALPLLSLDSNDKIKAVVITDGGVSECKNTHIQARLKEYVRAGGTVVYACQASSFTTYPDMNKIFRKAWGLSWKCTAYTRQDFRLNTAVIGLDCTGLRKTCNVKAVHLTGVHRHQSVYVPVPDAASPMPLRKSQDRETSGAAFGSVGRGFVGFVGDVNCEQPSDALVVAMCFTEGPPLRTPTSGHNSVEAPVQTAQNGEAQGTADKPRISVIILERPDWWDVNEAQLRSAMEKNAIVKEATNVGESVSQITASPAPSAVLVIDGAIHKARYKGLLKHLIQYAQKGGRVILAGQFSNELVYEETEPFFRKWGLPWGFGSYFRSTFALNPAGVPAPLNAATMFPTYSMNTTSLKNVRRGEAIYVLTKESFIESPVLPPDRVGVSDIENSPAVFGRVGKGCLGFVGDVNSEQQTTHVILEMLGVKWKAGELGNKEVSTGVTFRPDGGVQKMSDKVGEMRLPVHLRSKGPRDAEAAARSVKRAAQARVQQANGDRLKDQGNKHFRAGQYIEAAECYRAAVIAFGPRPLYLSNLAAALLKLKRHVLAEGAVRRALMNDPNHVKSRYRRGLARKELRNYKGAIADFRYILQNNPEAVDAREQLDATLALLANRSDEDNEDEEDEDPYMQHVHEIMTQSESSEYRHEGNGIPCKYNNHDGCRHGGDCHYKHAPDEKSVRDEIGRNVCVMWLFGVCRFGQKRCVYAHDKTYLPARGWWSDEKRLKKIRRAAKNMVLAGFPHDPEIFSNFLVTRWKAEKWFCSPYTYKKDGENDDDEWLGEKYGESEGWGRGQGDSDDGDSESDDDGDGESDGREQHGVYSDDDNDDSDDGSDDSDDPYELGFSRGEIQDLLAQGVKPWDDDARDVLRALRNF